MEITYRIKHFPALHPTWGTDHKYLPEFWAVEFHDGLCGWWTDSEHSTEESAKRAVPV